MDVEIEFYRDGSLDDPGPEHEKWCNKNQGPNSFLVECDCGVDDYAEPRPR